MLPFGAQEQDDFLQQFLAANEPVIIVRDEDDGPDRWSQVDRNSYEWLTSYLASNLDISKTQANAYVEEQAARYESDTGNWPISPYVLLNSAGFMDGAQRLATNLNALPEVFRMEDGTTIFNHGAGLIPVDAVVAGGSTGDPKLDEFINDILGPHVGVGMAVRHPNAAGGYTPAPVIPTDVLRQILQPQPIGGGGGGGSLPFTLDRNAVAERIRNDWRQLMLEEPNAEALADKYIAEAKAFRRKGGSLDLGVWIRTEARTTPKYNVLYGRKPETMSEDQWIGQYTAGARSFGFNETATVREIEAGASSGAGIGGFMDRVGNVREASLQAPFTQRMVNAVGRLGPLLAS